MRMRFRLLAACLVAVVFLMGCPKQPTRVNMVLAAASNVNPDPKGQPLSVVVRIYQLKDKGRLEAADYNSIWKNDKDTLAGDLVEPPQERIVQPGSQDVLEIRANPLATYLAVVALFRNPSGESWRRIIPIGGKVQKVNLTLREQTIEATTTTGK